MANQYQRVNYLYPEDFVNKVNLRSPDNSNVFTMIYGPDDIVLRVYNDRAPQFWTSFDDEYIIFDAWDSSVESTINASKTQVWAAQEPTLTLDDTTLIDLPDNLVQYLAAMAEARCFSYFKQEVNPKAEQREARQRIRSQRNRWRHRRNVVFHDGPDFARRPPYIL